MSHIARDNLNGARHALFGVSKFTYLGRNGVFLYLLGLWKSPLERVVLLGSGPIEPFEVSALSRFKDTIITAVDCDPEVYRIFREVQKGGKVDPKDLAQVCRSSDSENCYLLDDYRLQLQLFKVGQQGWYPRFVNESNSLVLYVNHLGLNHPTMILCDLQNEIPKDIDRADLVFEGFMLVNWAKSQSASSASELFLERLRERMSPGAWFASTTSVTHYRAEFPYSRPFLKQAIGAGLLPTVGLMVRWSVSGDGHVTSQFGSVFRKMDSVEDPLLQLGAGFERYTVSGMANFDVRCRCETRDVESLAAAFEEGDVLSYRAIGERDYRVVRGSWVEICRQCATKMRPYELMLDVSD
jgi:hypothetical protein